MVKETQTEPGRNESERLRETGRERLEIDALHSQRVKKRGREGERERERERERGRERGGRGERGGEGEKRIDRVSGICNELRKVQ